MGARLAAAAAIVATLVLTGCGAGAEREAGTPTGAAETGATQEEVLLPAPPIEAIDEPAPKGALKMLAQEGEGWTNYVPLEACEPEPCPDELVEEFEADLREASPVDGGEARAVARLRLDDGGAFYAVEYESQGFGTCTSVYGEDEDGLPLGGSGPGQACTEDSAGFACTGICVFPIGGFGDRVILGGLAPAEAESLRITFEDGFVARYPLTGPTPPGLPDRRVFLVDQEHGMFTTIELLEGDEVVAEEEFPDLGDVGAMERQTPGTVVELDGTTLHVEILPEAPPEAQALLRAEEVGFACIGADDRRTFLMEDASASAIERFEPGERTIDVELAAAPAGELLFCSAGEPGPVDAGLYRAFVPFEEIDEP